MKGVMDKLSSTFGKKPRETKKTSAGLKTRPSSTFPSTSRIYTGTNTRSNLPLSSRKDTQIPKPNSSRALAKETPTQVSQKGAGQSLKFHEEKKTRSPQTKDSKLHRDTVKDKTHEDKTSKTWETDDSKLYRDSRGDEIHKKEPTKTLQSGESELYSDFVEDLIIKETKPPPNTPQKFRQPRIDNLTDDGEKYRDNAQVDDDDFTNKYVSGLPDKPGDTRTDRSNWPGDLRARNDGDKDETVYLTEEYGATLVKALQFFQDESDDDIAVGRNPNFAPVEKNDDRNASASPLIEYPDSDKDVSLDIKKDTVYLLPKFNSSSLEDSQVTADKNIKSDDDYLSSKNDKISRNPGQIFDGYNEGEHASSRLKGDTSNFSCQLEKNTLAYDQDHKNNDTSFSPDISGDFDQCQSNKNQTVPKSNYPLVSPSSKHPEREKGIRQDCDDFFMDTDGLDGYGDGAYCIYESNEDISNICAQYEPSTSMYDHHPMRDNYDDDKFNTNYKKGADPFRRNNDQAMQKYHQESESGLHNKMERMVRQGSEEFLVGQEHNPSRVSGNNSAERSVVKNPRSKDEMGSIYTKQHLPNHSQNQAYSPSRIDSDKYDGRAFTDDVRRLTTKSDLNVSKSHKTQTGKLKTPGDTTASLSQSSGDSPIQLSLFGRWMVAHGQLVDPHNFCLWSYATYPDRYIDLSEYEMDLQGRWMDRNGRYITPFFYCYSYDGEPVYLGDCDYYDVFNDSYDIDTEYGDEFANNPERFIDLSSFQMDMDQRWMDCGEYIDPLTDWYCTDSDEDEYYEYGSLNIAPESLDLSGLPNVTNNFHQNNNLFLPEASSLASSGPYYMDYPAAGDYVFWDYPARDGNMMNVRESMQNLWLGTEDFYDDYNGTNEEDFDDKDSYRSRKYQYPKKTK